MVECIENHKKGSERSDIEKHKETQVEKSGVSSHRNQVKEDQRYRKNHKHAQKSEVTGEF